MYDITPLTSLLLHLHIYKYRSSGEVEATPSKDKTTKQLTIFFDGVINVYSNIPVDKVKIKIFKLNTCRYS